MDAETPPAAHDNTSSNRLSAAAQTTPDAATGPRPDRRALRQQLANLRRAQPAETIAHWSAAICAHLAATFPQLACQRVGFCWPIHNEPDLRPLLDAWRAQGATGFAALLPVVVAPAAPLAFRAWDAATRLEADRYGIPTPACGEFQTPQALLIPVNAFDAAGYRLGYGGGFFDRTLAALSPRPLAIGVGFELARVASIAPEAHDIRLDAVVTEAGVFSTDPG